MVFSSTSLASVALSLLALSEAKAISNGHASTTAKPATTFSIPTASSAPSTASLPTIDHGREYINYTTVTGFFLQDVNGTVASTFDYVSMPVSIRNVTVLTMIRRLPILV